MIGWMFFYILAIPVFSFYVPLYSFWHMDDFSWGQTRVIMGESGKKLVVHVSALRIQMSSHSLTWCLSIGRRKVRPSRYTSQILDRIRKSSFPIISAAMLTRPF